ncbi:delta endotoxin [Modicisalibacter ilicicola DSM 19980]|uniref:Delta endotoxin n=1 Tax=Modicisalibacter ilicicola DSM 19980 TaxID=1121942 RepID=A0A1M4X014_9GAMM|nr:carbohydrate-binding protein [Halomonas ilicicola]SHE86800.1 delta endotoxin [Halomonas ilicicola DSM 19980]
MFSISLINTSSGALLGGLKGGQRIDTSALGDYALRIVPVAGTGVDPLDVKGIRLALTDAEGVTTTFTDSSAPFVFGNLPALTSGTTSLGIEALDAEGAVLAGGSEQIDFIAADGMPAVFEAVRVQAEDTGDGDGDGNFTTLSPEASGLAVVSDDPNGVNAEGGAYVDYGAASGETLTFSVNVPEAGEYELALSYALSQNNDGSDRNRPLRLEVNEQLVDRTFDLPSTTDTADAGDFTTFGERTIRVTLEEGQNTISFTSNGASGPNVDYLEVRKPALGSLVIQGEELTLSPAPDISSGGSDTNRPITMDNIAIVDDTFRVGAEGASYLDWAFGNASAYGEFIFEAPVAGTYSITVTYAGSSDRPLDLFLVEEGTPTDIGTFAFTATTAPESLPDDIDDIPGTVDLPTEPSPWEGWTTETLEISLGAGENLLRLGGRANGPNIDKIEMALVSADPVAPTTISLDNDSVLENEVGAAIGQLSVEDLDDSTHTFTVDDARFEVDANGILRLKSGESLDFEAEQSVTLNVTATDADEASVTETFVIAVGDVQEGVVVPPPAFEPIVIQAEDGLLGAGNDPGTLVRDADNPEAGTGFQGLRPDYSGSGYLDFGSKPGDVVTFTIEVTEGGSYDLNVRYASNGDRPLALSVNEGGASNVPFPGTDPDGSGELEGFDNWEYVTVPVTLNAGENTIALAIPSGASKGPNLDRVEITEAGSGPIGDVTADQDDDLALSVQEEVVNADAAGALVFTLAGIDDDITSVEVSLDGGETRQGVTLGEAGEFTLDVSGLAEGTNTAMVYLMDTAGNRASSSTNFTLDTSADSDGDLALAGPEEAVAAGSTATTFDVAGLDADIGTLEVSFDDGETRQAVTAVDGAVTLDLSALPVGTSTVTLYATDGAGNEASASTSVTLEAPSSGPLDITFDNVTSYTSTQDNPVNAPGYVVSEDATSLALNDNLWKRVDLPREYTLSEQTQIVLDLAIGENDPEIVAVGFDLDENAFDGDRSIYQVGGTQGQGAFIDLRGSGIDNGDGTTRFTIDLGEHAGITIDSLVFVSDDDATAVLGSATFSNVQLVEDVDTGSENSAPRVVGGGIADLQVDEDGTLEVDLPFVDDDGDALSYSFALSQSGVPVEDAGGLAISAGVLGGSVVGLEAGTYTVTITADDGSVTTDTAFELTVNNVNEAPVAEDAALEPYFGELGSFFDGIELASFAGYFSDPDGDTLTLSVEGLPAGLSVDEEGVISGTPAEAGMFDVVIRATDGEGLSDTLSLQFEIEGPQAGDTISVEAENFTGLAEADNFFVTGNADASGNQIIRLANGQTETQVTTELADNGVVPGWYSVSVVVFDEDDGAGTLSLQIGDTALQARNLTSDTLTENVVLDDDFGTFLDDGPRGNAAQAGNLKQIAFETPVYVDAATLATLTVQGESGELMRIDQLVFTRIEEPTNEAPTITGLASTIAIDENTSDVATLTLADAEGDALGVTLEGADAALFSFDQTTGALSFVEAPDAETPADANGDGLYELTVSVSDGENVTSQDVVVSINDLDETPFSPITIQAEDGTLTVLDDGSNASVTTVRDPGNPEDNDNLPNGLRPDFSGTGYVDFGDTAGDAVTFDVTVGQAGTYDLNIRYASNTARPLELSVNGGSGTELPFASTDPDGSGAEEGFDHWAFETVTITLEAGSNSVSLAIPEGANTGPNIDRIEITEAGSGPIPIDTSADEDGDLALIAADATLAPDDAATAGFTVSGIDDDIQTVEISLDGGATRSVVTPDANGDFSVDLSSLSGDVTATLFVTDAAGNEASASAELTIGDAPVDVDPITIQAEDASLVQINDSGVPTSGDFTRVVDAANPDAFGNYREGGIGGAYVDFGTNPGDEVVFNVDAEVAGTYTATIRFANGGEEARPLNLSINGGTASLVAFPATPDDGVNEPWAVWNELEVEVELEAGSNQVSFAIPSTAEGGVDNGPNIDQVVFAYNDDGEAPAEPFLFEIQGEALTIDDTEPTPDTQVRDASNPETNPGAGADGLWDGYTGSGYLDMGSEAGDAASFEVTVEEAGTYTLSVRYANGSTTQADRPMDILVGGVSQGEMAFAATGEGNAGWQNWTEATIEVELAAGSNTIRLENVGDAGPNIDSLSVSRDGTTEPEEPASEPGERFKVKINFQPDGFVTPDGYVADTGLAFGEQSVEIGGQTYQYGWVSEASIADGTDNGTTPLAIKGQSSVAINDRTDDIAGLDPLQGTYAHFALPGYAEKAGWEMELENGFYEVTVAIGDTSGPFDSNYVLNAEGELFNDPFAPFRPEDFPADGNPSNDTEGFRSDLVTKVVQVTDGRLTLDSIGLESFNTEIQYLEIQSLPDLTPDDDRDAPEDYAFFTDPRAIAGVGADEVEVNLDPQDGSAPTGVDPSSDIFLGISVVDGRGGVLLESLQDGSVRLFETVSGEEVAFNVNTTGGFDSLTISPTGGLKEFTSYTLKIDGFRDRGDNDDLDAPTREFQKFSTTFVTGEAPEVVAREVAFNDVVELNGAQDGAFGLTSLELSPDGSKMYVASMGGEIKRYDVDPVTGALSGEQTLALDHFQGSAGPRGIIGIVFDPTDPNVLWVSDNYPIPLSGRDNGVPDFSGRITKITLGEGDDFTATAETYVTGLPRSNGDHVTNSLEFRANPDYDAQTNPDAPSHLLYVVQGSNSAMGEADSAWGFRPERLLNANVLEIDPTRDAPEGGFDVSTEPLPSDGQNRRFVDDDGNVKDDPIPMGNGQFLVFAENGTATVQDASGTILDSFYDPFADDAVVKIFATGIRNAYDLVWHSNGYMYVPTNGSAAGGSVPDDPSTPLNEKRTGVEKQDDYLFKVEEGGYYGHPNPLRDEYILNGGNPSSGNDTNQVGNYPAGVDPDANYRVDDAYSLGENRSPNGVTEYTSGVFGGNLQGSVLFTEYSGGDDIRSITLDADGNVTGDTVLRDVNGNVITYVDPLDIIENPATGQLYLLTLNRGNGQSQLVRLDPAPGGVITDPGDGGGDGGDNGGDNGDLVSLLTIQAEDATPTDGTSVTTASGGGAEIEIRTVDNPEPNPDLQPLGLRPGSFGVDGNTDDTDGSPGGYADFGSTNADFLTFNFELTGDQAGASVLQVRYANGATANRPLEVFVNNVSVGTFAFAPPSDVTGDDAWNTWQTLDIPAELVSGLNTVRFQATAATGPNIDQLEILQEPEDTTPGYAEYEAESAQLDGPVVVNASDDDRNASGDGFVDFDGASDQSITWTVDVAEAGTYEIGIRYALAASKDDRPLDLAINGNAIGALNFPGQSNDAEDDWFYQTTTVTLNAGSNTISVTAPGANGPNVDLLRVADDPIDTFEPTYAAVDGETRIELESGDTARAVNANTADFYFTVAEDGAYKLDLAANAGASDGGQLTLLLNGQPLDELSFPGVGDDGEESAFVELEAGVSYNLRVVSSAAGADDIDYLDVSPAPGDPDADIGIQSGDAAHFSDRLHFNYLENNSASNDDRDFKESGSVVISNTGSADLSIIDADMTGPFELADPDIFTGLTLGAGESITVEILFDREAYTPPSTNGGDGVFEGALRLVTNDADTPVAEVHLAGFWQARDEGGWEPNVNEVWEVFGFGNVIEGLTTVGGGENSVLNDFDLYRPVNDDEVLSRYWKIADGFESAKITQIAAFHGDGGASLGIHNPGNKGQDVTLSNHAGDNNQSILPIKSNGQFATATITKDLIPDGWLGNDIFGIEVAGLSTDPSLNPTGGGTVPADAEGIERGYTVRMFQALDANGNVIPNTYLGVMDYTGINYDYNDNMFVIEGIEPASGGEISIENLDGVPSDDRLVMSRIENPANANQEVHDEVTFTITNDGFADLEISSLDIADPTLFEIVGDSTDLVVPAGSSLNVTVRFIASDSNDGSLYESTLTINSNDGDEGQKVIQLAGIAQGQSESGQEPMVQEIVNAFGFSTNVAEGEMNKGGLVEANGDEILSPYFQRADGSAPIKITQLAAYHGQGDIARLFIHDVDSRDIDEILAHDEQDGQTLLPRALNAGDQLTTTTLERDDPFGFFAEISDRQGYISWSDPDANLYEDTIDAIGNPGNDLSWDENDGHLIRVYVAKDAEGNVIPDTYIVIQDYAGVNYDYNDNIFLVENVQTYDPTGAEDADGNGRVDLYDDDDGDGTPNFLDGDGPVVEQTAFNDSETPWAVGAEGLSLEAKLFDNGGQGVAYNDTTASHQGASFRSGEAVDISNGTEALGYIADGEWVEYTLNVETAGTYALSFLTSAVSDGKSISAAFEQNGSFYTTDSIGVPNTGSFTTFQNVGPLEFDLDAGVQTLRLTFNGGQLDLQSFELEAVAAANNAPVVDAGLADLTVSADEAFSFTVPADAFEDADGDTLSYTASGLPDGLSISPAGLISGTPTTAGSFDILVTASDGSASVETGFTLTVEPATGSDEQVAFNATQTAWAVGDELTLDAALYDAGGQDVAYNDSSEAQEGSNFRGDGVDIVGDGSAIGWVEDGEWVEYTLNVAEAGTYDLSFLSALGTQSGGARSITASFAQSGGVYETASSVGVDYSGGWTSFEQTGSTQVELAAGEQVLRLTFNGGSQDLASFTLAQVDTNSAPTVEAGLTDLTATADEAFSFTIPSNAFEDADGDALTYTASGLPSGLSISPSGVISGTPTAAGSFDILVTASDGSASVETGFTLDVETAPVDDGQSAFNAGGTPWSVGESLTLEAALFDEGGQDVAYNDSSATKLGDSFRDGGVDTVGDGRAIGYVEDGEWVEYTINVEQAGTYSLSFMTAAKGDGRTITASVEQGGNVYATSEPLDAGVSGDWNTYIPTAALELDLQAGEQVLRLTFNGGSMDLQSWTLEQGGVDGQQAFNDTGTPWLVDEDGLSLDAVLFDKGGQDVAYNDSSEVQRGDDFREDGVDVVGNGEAIGYVEDGEWVEYTINVEQAGTYSLSFETATPDDGRTITASAEQNGTFYATSGPLAVPNSGDWGNYVTTQALTLDLQAGEQVLRLTFNGGEMDLKSLNIEQQPGATSAQSLALDESFLIEETSPAANDDVVPMSDDVSLAGLEVDGTEDYML